MRSALELFWIFLRLGMTSFGGPVAHLGYFHREFVAKRKWFDEHAYADLVALCQFLPGPASSQVGIAIGLSRAGIPGAAAAWLGFTLPSAALLVIFALGLSNSAVHFDGALLHGLKIAAVSIVAQAVWMMAKRLCPDWKRASFALLAALVAFLIPSAVGQIAAILIGGLCGLAMFRDIPILPHAPLKTNLSARFAAGCLFSFLLALALLPFLARQMPFESLKLFDSFFRAGSLVFGGGHVVLPLLKAEVVTPGWVSADAFMAGYGAAQAIPGPLFTFSAYLGAIAHFGPSGVSGALVCLLAAFAPSFFLVFGTLPFWEKLRSSRRLRAAAVGTNAAVVGLLLAAFYNPVWTSAIFSWKDLLAALALFALLMVRNVPSWGIVVLGIAAGGFFL